MSKAPICASLWTLGFIPTASLTGPVPASILFAPGLRSFFGIVGLQSHQEIPREVNFGLSIGGVERLRDLGGHDDHQLSALFVLVLGFEQRAQNGDTAQYG